MKRKYVYCKREGFTLKIGVPQSEANVFASKWSILLKTAQQYGAVIRPNGDLVEQYSFDMAEEDFLSLIDK